MTDSLPRSDPAGLVGCLPNSALILVVDDSRQISDILVELILPSLGYLALAAYDGHSGLELLRRQPVDLLLLDLHLPDMTGLELLRQLEREGLRVPTILSTAHGSERVAVEALRLGVQDYLVKPVDPDELQASIQRILAGARQEHAQQRLTGQLRQQVSWLKVLYAVGQSVISTLDVDEVLRRIVEAGVHLTHAEQGFLALQDERTGELVVRAARRRHDDRSHSLPGPWPVLPAQDQVIHQVLRDRRALRQRRSDGSRPSGIATGALVQSLIHAPLVARGLSMGVLTVETLEAGREFGPEDEALLTSLADWAAVAIENARLYERAQAEIVERLRVESALRVSEERYALAVRGANDGLWDWDLRLNQVYYSPRWKSMLGCAEEEIGASIDDWLGRVHPEDVERLRLDVSAHLQGSATHLENEHRMLHQDGGYRWVLCRGLAVRDENGAATRLAGSQTDITDRKRAEQKLLHDALYDGLTGLPNRALLLDRLKGSIERVRRRPGSRFAVLFLDLDRFKDINDTLGHLVGDQLLIAVGNMLRSGVRATDTVARLSGDEFVILMDDIHDLGAATRVADWALRKLNTPFRLAEHQVFVNASIGIVLGLPGYNRPDDVLRDADIAMYAAKADGKGRHAIFRPAMRERIVERMALEGALREAIEASSFQLHYQPIVSLETGKLSGLEALARWPHPGRGLLSPADFLPLAEETGLVVAIDGWALWEGCRQASDWIERFPALSSITFHINLSGRSFARLELPAELSYTLEETRLSPHNLRLEVSESAFIEHSAASREVFKALQKMGVEVQIDHFGTGYSSLGYLHQFPVDALKVDRSFIMHMQGDGRDPEIVRTVAALAHELGVQAIAGGVETEDQLDQLRSLGYDLGQGYRISGPLESAAIPDLLARAAAGESILQPVH